MARYVGLLRGVNVGGVTIKMAELADLVRGLGYEDVTTVLASGNVLFTTDDDAPTAKGRLETALRERFGYEAWVQVLTIDAIRAIVDAYPFERARDGWHDYVVFVDEPAVIDELMTVEFDEADERAEAGHQVVYWTVPKGRTLETAFSKAQSSAKRKRHVTTRNLNTLDRLLR